MQTNYTRVFCKDKYCSRTLRLVIHNVRFQKEPAKKYITVQGGVKLKTPSGSGKAPHCNPR